MKPRKPKRIKLVRRRINLVRLKAPGFKLLTAAQVAQVTREIRKSFPGAVLKPGKDPLTECVWLLQYTK